MILFLNNVITVYYQCLHALRDGDFSVRLSAASSGAANSLSDDISREIAAAFNDVASRHQSLLSELQRVSTAVGKEGIITERMNMHPLGDDEKPLELEGDWSECFESINVLVEDLTRPTTEVVGVVEAVARGDLTKTMRLDSTGIPLKGNQTHLNAYASCIAIDLGLFRFVLTDIVTR